MDHITGKFWTATTYLTSLMAWFTFDTFSKVVLFMIAVVLGSLQIYLYWIKIKKEKDNK